MLNVNQQLKKIIMLTMTAFLLCFSNGNFADHLNLSFNHIVFFGDSLSDDGNLYYYDDGLLPTSPPYYYGRFSNGPTWAELAAKKFSSIAGVTSENYAIGGATAILHDPINGYAPYSLSFEINDYLVRNLFSSKANTLFVFWIGGNDYLLTDKNVDKATTETVHAIETQIKRLVYYGARNFVVINLPDISKTPSAKDRGVVSNLHALVLEHNQKLKIMLDKLQANQPEIKITQVDIFTPFNNFLLNPQKYNKIYGTNITDLTDPCWGGGFNDKNPTLNQIEDEINQNISRIQGNSDSQQNKKHQPINASQLLTAFQNSPSLQESYVVSQEYREGESPCSNPDNYLFWDHIHPSEALHLIIETIITQDILAATKNS